MEKKKKEFLEQFDQLMSIVVAPNDWCGIEAECLIEGFNLELEIKKQIKSLEMKKEKLVSLLKEIDEPIGFNDLKNFIKEKHNS